MNILSFHIPEQVFTFVNLIIMFLILRAVLFKPVTKFMDARTQRIKEAVESAEDARAEQEIFKRKREEEYKQFEKETIDMLREARERAGKEYDRIVKDAEAKSASIIAAAEIKAAKERERLFEESKDYIIKLSIAAASRILEGSIDEDANKSIVQAFIEREGAA